MSFTKHLFWPKSFWQKSFWPKLFLTKNISDIDRETPEWFLLYFAQLAPLHQLISWSESAFLLDATIVCTHCLPIRKQNHSVLKVAPAARRIIKFTQGSLFYQTIFLTKIINGGSGQGIQFFRLGNSTKTIYSQNLLRHRSSDQDHVELPLLWLQTNEIMLKKLLW